MMLLREILGMTFWMVIFFGMIFQRALKPCLPQVGFFAGGEFGPVGLRTAFSGDNFVFDVGNWETADLARFGPL